MNTPLLSTCILFLLAACGSKGSEVIAPPPGKPPVAVEAEDHGVPKALGSMTIGAHTFAVTQFGDITPGKESAVEMDFPDGKPVPSTVRAWIGIESGEGSLKQRCGKEGDHGLHGHIEVPKTLPVGSKLWIEIEENGKTQSASVAWK